MVITRVCRSQGVGVGSGGGQWWVIEDKKKGGGGGRSMYGHSSGLVQGRTQSGGSWGSGPHVLVDPQTLWI